jgi:hypothetical protein
VPQLYDVLTKTRLNYANTSDVSVSKPSAVCLMLHHLRYFEHMRSPEQPQKNPWMKTTHSDNVVYWAPWCEPDERVSPNVRVAFREVSLFFKINLRRH